MDSLRAILNRDRVWCAFALADLDPEHAPFCSWRVADEGLLLLYSGFTPPLLFAAGLAEPLLEDLQGEFYASLRPPFLDILQARGWHVEKRILLHRMVFEGRELEVDRRAVRLTPADLDAVERLYADGEVTGERPPFFHPRFLADGVFYGVWEDRELAAISGTLVCSTAEKVACLGNVYTRRDSRGRGLAGITTAAVVSELRRQGMATVALNVHADNPAAIRVYERLRFSIYCDYEEALIARKP
jgi:GNAT superfamily N-acetyltransferase